jgi:RNA polymerase sigma factor (TIGR02999 family)
MRRIAHGLMKGEQEGHSLHTTALVNEAVLKLLRTPALEGVTDRVHLFTIVGQVMRHILIDHARNKGAEKRGGGRTRVSLEEAEELLSEKAALSASDLAEALAALEIRHARASAVVHLRYFGGHSVADIAQILNVSVSTVESDWRFARAWLFARLENG